MTFSRSSLTVPQSVSCDQLCDPMDCSTPGSSVLHYLPSLLKFMSIEWCYLTTSSSTWPLKAGVPPGPLSFSPYLLFSVSFHTTMKNSDMMFPPKSTIWTQALLWAPGPVPDCLPDSTLGCLTAISNFCLVRTADLPTFPKLPSCCSVAKPCATLLQLHGL